MERLAAVVVAAATVIIVRSATPPDVDRTRRHSGLDRVV
jgi:hypothetical protein